MKRILLGILIGALLTVNCSPTNTAAKTQDGWTDVGGGLEMYQPSAFIRCYRWVGGGNYNAPLSCATIS